MQVVKGRFVDVDLALGKRSAGQGLLEEVGNPYGNLVARQAREVMTGVGLRIEIDKQGAITLRGADRRQVAGNAGLAYATF